MGSKREIPTPFGFAALVAAGLIALTSQSPADDIPFVERPGIVEFSGQMIVRPHQPAAMGMDVSSAAAHDRAVARLMPRVLKYVQATDEYVVRVPLGETENSYSAALLATGDYQYATPNWICHPTRVPNDSDYSRQWHHFKINSPAAWDFTVGSTNVIVADVDGGAQLDHPDLAGALTPGYNARDRVAQVDGGDVTDVDGHGTFVIGLAGAIGANHLDVVGMCWRVALMPVRYYNSPGGGYLDDVLDGARWAVDHGAKCVNVSQTGVEYDPVETTGAYIMNHGGLLFWAAGNDARDLSWFHWDHVIVVGATDPNDARASFSAYGHAVDVYAPGTDILSTGIPSVEAIGSGTSAATPLVAGTAALLWSAQPGLTPDQVRQRIFENCVDLGVPGHDDTWGWGRLDAYATLRPPPCPGDLSGDGKVDLVDVASVLGNYGCTGSACQGDANADGETDLGDLAFVLSVYGQVCQ